ncbi:MAG: OsmC family protein [Anaerolineae bacterium]|nr:OsmC family protein [Anaerolineae bacterium]NUQ06426.1 OsmC family protein [Anaerolineae bacterium]
MSTLDPYLARKHATIEQRRAECEHEPSKALLSLKSVSRVAGATGVRPTELSRHTIITDAAPGLGGYGLGPTAPELLLGALSSCLAHTYLIEAALNRIPLESVEVEVSGRLDMTGVYGLPTEEAPQLSEITYHANVVAPIPPEVMQRLHDLVEAGCPVLNTLRSPIPVTRV